MTRKLLVRQGGFTAAEVDFINDFAARKGAPWLDGSSAPLIQMAHRFANGESAQGYFKITDPDALLSTAGFRLRPWAEVRLTEDASGSELTLAWMRVTANDASRLTSTIAGDEVEHDPQLMDINLDLRGIPWRDGWERPAETDWDRLDALEAAKLNGSASTAPIHRNSTDITIARTINGHLVNVEGGETDLDANDYPAGTEQFEIISDVATQSGKIFGVVLHHDGGTHKCLLYIDQDDLTTYTTGVRISDDPADWDPSDPTTPTFEPHWRMGAAREQNMEDVASGIISIYAGLDNDPRTVFVQTGDPDDEWETWIAVYHDDLANQHLAQATRRANWILADRRLPYQTHQVSILVSAEQAHLVEAGMAIETKSVAMEPGPNRHAWIWRRVAEKAIEPEADGRYWLHLHLERPHHTHGAGGGAGQPAVTTPKPPVPPVPGTVTTVTNTAGHGDNDENEGVTVTAGQGQLIGVLQTYYLSATPAPEYWSDSGGTSIQNMTIIGSITHPLGPFTGGHGNKLFIARLENPVASGAGASIKWGPPGGLAGMKGYWTSPSSAVPTVITNSGTGVTASVTPTGAAAEDLVLMCAGNRIASFGDAGNTPVDLSSQTDDWAVDMNNGSGQADGTWYGGHLAGAGIREVSMVVSRNWLAAAIILGGTGGTAGDETEPVGGTGDGDVGSGGVFSPIGHVHEHGLLSDDELHYHDVSQIEGLPASPNVEDLPTAETDTSLVLAPDGSGGVEWALGGAGDHGDLTGLADNDHPQYRLTSQGGQDVISVVAAAGGTETLDLANGNVHDVTLTADCTITLSGATGGVECSMAVLLRQGSGAPWEVTWPASVEWVGGAAPVLETAVNAWNWVNLTTLDGGTVWFGDGGAVGSGVEPSDLVALGVVGPILIADDHSTPLVFADLLQTEEGDDLLYADIGA